MLSQRRTLPPGPTGPVAAVAAAAALTALGLPPCSWPAAAQTRPMGLSEMFELGAGPGARRAAPPPRSGARDPHRVTVEDLTYTLRLANFTALAHSPHDPQVAYLASREGYVFRTTDGGRTWDESRLIVEPRHFFGDQYQTLYFGAHRASRSPAAAGEAPSPSPGLTFGPSAGAEATGGSAGDTETRGPANANFGIGLPGGAPRLQLTVRKLGKKTSGLNFRQTLLEAGSRPLTIFKLVIHPGDPRVVFACTAFGLFKTYDRGLNWVRVFVGTSRWGRMVLHAAVDPSDHRRVLIGTGEGLYVSGDGGESFLKATRKGVGEGTINWIRFHPRRPRVVLVATNHGLLRSTDGGQGWQWAYYTTFRPARRVRHVEVDPHHPTRGYIATEDGLLVSDDIVDGGLESWRRLGGLQFTGLHTTRLTACPAHPGHLLTQSVIKLPSAVLPGTHPAGGSFLWESRDGGTTWQALFSGETKGRMEWFEPDVSDPDLVWIVWSRAVLRMRRTDGVTHRGPLRVPPGPPVGDVVMAGLKYLGLEVGQQLAYRSRARLRALVPTVTLSYDHFVTHDHDQTHLGMLPDLPYGRRGGQGLQGGDVRVLLAWDLAPLLFSLKTEMFGRVDRVSHELRGWVRHELYRFHSELRRLEVLMATEPPADLRVRVLYRLRIEELTVLIDFLTGGYLTYWQGGGRDPGEATRWWTRWSRSRTPGTRARAGPGRADR